jgi:hypothetical protein
MPTKLALPICSAMTLAAAAFLAVACSDDDSPNGTGQLKLAVADAPVDGATHVVVVFTGVELTGNGDDKVDIDFDTPKSIDLLTQSGTASAVLFDTPVPAGSYGQIRLKVVADGDASNSYIDLEGGERKGLRIPSGEQSGLKLVSGFTVPESGVVSYTVDFDLRKAITCPPGQDPACILKPALRLVNNSAVGNIQGIVDPSLTVDEGCEPGVYLFSGSPSPLADNNLNSTSASQPIASKVPVQTEVGLYYQFTFLTPGSYTVAYTCNADDDDPEAADAEVTFDPVEDDVTVTAGQTTDVDLPVVP